MTRTLALVVFMLAPLATVRADPAVVAVEPAELTKRADLIGREVVVDDRVRLFQLHPGRGIDEIELKRTPVVFRLPPRLRPEHAPNAKVVRVQGILRRDDDRWTCDVTAFETLPDDLDRLNEGVAALPARDAEGRLGWARWAERRGKDFQDDKLKARARALELEALHIEADRPSADPLVLARRAKDRGLGAAEASALAHRGLRAELATARTVDDLSAVRGRVEEFLPKSAQRPADPVDVSPWEAPYANDPSGAYRAASPGVREALDHRLWADVTQRLLERELAADPGRGLSLAEQAATQLPDRPELATRFLETGLSAATRNLSKLRRGEVDTLAKVFRDQLHQPERARALYRDWLTEQRKTLLRPTDAEGRIDLADRFQEILGDRETAIELLQEAWKIDPDSKKAADAFRSYDYKKNVRGEWVDAGRPRLGGAPVPTDDEARRPRPSPRDRQMLGLTPNEAERALGGKPQRIVRAATQGQLIIQWIYIDGDKTRYVNFLQTPGDRKPRSVAFYSLRTAG